MVEPTYLKTCFFFALVFCCWHCSLSDDREREMSLESYLRALDASYRDQDGPSVARYLGADAADIPSSGFVSYLKEVCVCGAATAAFVVLLVPA